MAEALACNTGHILKVISMKPKKKLWTVDGSMVAYIFANRDKCREPKRQKEKELVTLGLEPKTSALSAPRSTD